MPGPLNAAEVWKRLGPLGDFHVQIGGRGGSIRCSEI